MSDDLLKDLLTGDVETAAPAYTMGFTLDVMARIERRRLIDSLVMIGAGFVIVCVVLALIMPYLNPAIVTLSQAALPIVLILAALSAVALGWQTMKPGLRMIGLPV